MHNCGEIHPKSVQMNGNYCKFSYKLLCNDNTILGQMYVKVTFDATFYMSNF